VQRIKKENPKETNERSETIETRGDGFWCVCVFFGFVCLYWKKSVGSHHTLNNKSHFVCLFVCFLFLFHF